jgi:hypothetical protein
MLNKLILIAGLDSDEMIKFVYDKSGEFEDSLILKFPENSKHPSKVRNDLKFYVEEEKNLIICSHADYVWSYLRFLILQKTINIENVEIWWLDKNPTQVKINKWTNTYYPIDGFF